MFTAVWKRVPQLLLVAAVLVAAPAASQTASKFPVTGLSLRSPWTGSGPVNDWDNGWGVDFHAGWLVLPKFSFGLGGRRNWHEAGSGYSATTNAVFLHIESFYFNDDQKRLERFLGIRLGYARAIGDSPMVDGLQNGFILEMTSNFSSLGFFKKRFSIDMVTYMTIEWYTEGGPYFGVGWMHGLGTQPI